MPTTVLICATDPALRALARGTFTDPGWYVLESGFAELPQLAGSVQVDVAIVISASDGARAIVRDAFVGARSRLDHLVMVRHASGARESVRQLLGR